MKILQEKQVHLTILTYDRSVAVGHAPQSPWFPWDIFKRTLQLHFTQGTLKITVHFDMQE